MSALARSAQDYLEMRRSVGYVLRQEWRMLADFVGYCERRGITRVTTEATLGWATEPAAASSTWWAKRLGVVRGFAAHLKTLQEDTEVPPRGLLPGRASRMTPYLFSPAQITALMAAAHALAHPLRDQLCPRPATRSFLLSGGGTRLNHTNASTTFGGLLDSAGIATPAGRRRPRLYDLRHSFAVATLVGWHAEGADVQARLPVLSTWMGHVKPSSTYWYLHATPELLAVTAGRLERYLEGQP
jgi:integrase